LALQLAVCSHSACAAADLQDAYLPPQPAVRTAIQVSDIKGTRRRHTLPADAAGAVTTMTTPSYSTDELLLTKRPWA